MASPETFLAGTIDGHLQSVNAAYATARTGGTIGLDNTNTNIYIGQRTAYTVYEGYIQFDTSGLPDDCTITDVVLSLYGSGGDAQGFTVNARAYNWGASLTTADWVSGADLHVLPLLATIPQSVLKGAAAYHDFTSEAAFLTNINKTGSTYIILSSSRHEEGTAPSTYERVTPRSANMGAGYEPKLVVTYTTLTAVAQTLSPTYNIINLVAQTLTPAYDIEAIGLTAVAQTLTPAYSLRRLVDQTLSPAYAMRNLAVQTLTPAYLIRQLAAQSLTPTYDLRTAVAQTLSPAYGVLNLAARTLTPTYLVRELVGASLTPTYAILFVVVPRHTKKLHSISEVAIMEDPPRINKRGIIDIRDTIRRLPNKGVVKI